MKTSNDQVIRVALYCRVSTDEQVMHGYSMQAQEEELLRFAEANCMKVAGIYRDEGFSARKPLFKRKVMLDLLEDAKNRKFDRILFIKLDRWFRSLAEYYKCQAILEEHRVSWQATMEDYNTATSDGRLKVNIMLSVAEAEADKTSERIKFVFDSKVNRKEAISGARILPLGYTVREIDGVRRVVKDPETEHIVNEFFRMLSQGFSIRYASTLVVEKYGIVRSYTQWHRMARTEMYIGKYRGVTDYCEPYITQEEFDAIAANSTQAVRKTQQNRVYLFAGLMKCPRCGRRLSAKYNTGDNGQEYVYYRCYKSVNKACDYNIKIAETAIERYLLENLREEMQGLVLTADAVAASSTKPPQKPESEKLQEKLRRINVAYFANNMSDEEYAERTKALQAQIAEAQAEEAKQEKPVNLDALREILSTDFESIYLTLTRQEKRRLWRSFIQEIYTNGKEVAGVKFRS